jgi:hypothetical protein
MAAYANRMAICDKADVSRNFYMKNRPQVSVNYEFIRLTSGIERYKKSPPTQCVSGKQPYVSGQKHRLGDVSARAVSNVLTKK